MTEQMQETEATLEELETSPEGMETEEPTGAETKEQQDEKQPDDRDAEIARLKAEAKRKDDRIATLKGNSKIATSVVKGIMNEYGLDYEEAVKYAGANITSKDLQGRFESAEIADNPFEVQAKAFNDLYLNAGVKGTLDDIYGEDTQQFVAAFERAVKADDELASDFASIEPTKLPTFVVKKGKEFLEKQKQTLTLAEENTRLKAELEALKSGKPDPEAVMDKRKTLPLSGLGATGSMGNQAPSGFAERLFG
jgi:uncharacterized small protein (DUF1192 family)